MQHPFIPFPLAHREPLHRNSVPFPAPLTSTTCWLLSSWIFQFLISFKLIPSMVQSTLLLLYTGPPVYANACWLAPDKLAIAKVEFYSMETMGIIQRSSSPWASPLQLAPKASGSWRPCGDYRCLNGAKVPDQYLVPHVHNWQLRISPKLQVLPLLGYTSSWECRSVWRMPAEAFQHLMDTVCQGLSFAFVHVDDMLVATKDVATHNEHYACCSSNFKTTALLSTLSRAISVARLPLPNTATSRLQPCYQHCQEPVRSQDCHCLTKWMPSHASSHPNSQRPEGVCGDGQLLLKVHPSWCTVNVTSLRH